jgi:hypothetical protein
VIVPSQAHKSGDLQACSHRRTSTACELVSDVRALSYRAGTARVGREPEERGSADEA